MSDQLRIALVTGGAVRVGAAISRALAREGMRVFIHHYGSHAAAEALVAEIRAAGGAAEPIRADLRDAAATERLAREVMERTGGVLDLLVNNASVFPAERLEETSAELWDETLAVNLRAPFLLTRALAPALRARRGRIVNLADLAGVQAWTTHAAHGVAKAGLLHLTRVSARALAPEVRVNAIVPGTVLPPESLTADEVRTLAERTPLRRNGSPDDVVEALLYLARAEFVTGEGLFVDGGRRLRT